MMASILRALSMAFAMGWEILWPLILGFALSAVVQAVVSHREMARLLPDDRPRSIATALALGGASSSCAFPQGRQFPRRHGVRDGVHQSRRRTKHHHAGVPWLAAHAGRIRWCTDHG